MARWIYIFLFITLLTNNMYSQQSNVMYYMQETPQSALLNPAKQFKCRFYMGVPALSSIHFNYGNTGFSYLDGFKKENSAYVIDPGKFLRKIHKKDIISTQFHYQVLAFGYKYKGYALTFGLQEKNEAYTTLPGDLFGFAINGNGPYEGKEIDLSKIGVNAFHYREYAFGVSKKTNEYATFGARAKLLFGKGNVNTKKSDISIFTRENYFDWLVKTNTRVNVSGPVSLELDEYGIVSNVAYDNSLSIMQLIFNRKNPGIALDGGFEYQYSDKFSYSGSFIDLGFIRWRSQLTNLSQEGELNFTGLNSPQAIDESYFMNLLDSIRRDFAPVKSTEKYTIFLPLKLYGGARYQVTPKIGLGILGRGMVYQWRFYPSLIASVNTNFAKFFSLNLSYAFNNYSINNLGLGLSLQSRNFQFYLLSDHIPLRYGTVAGVPVPVASRNINIRLGMNLFFGCKKKVQNSDCFGCYWLDQREIKRENKERFLKGKDRKK